jgi:hypothetical protein
MRIGSLAEDEGETMNEGNIIVKDYIWKGNYIFGTFYMTTEDKNGNTINNYILDDGDIYTIKHLEDEGYTVLKLSSKDIIDVFKERFGK